ncbi:pilus assembly protein N-terminal domain-containing protein [Rubripirellula amarantea]|uniref:Putative type II secretion system protein D n=1 Tax=Rubripirellula amarantea TaxID=2527999 RepID=A0A5C5WT74_9BACT|nr:pilus assembly protein N-terminal domain-containing protein [Rubripirellula amarantea]MDA8745587.1 pilus assembly protein N-terminal domain-containing protein [Rubripirellula amarantea]TWT54124.1 putative type II secretion system protein D precursor [Rubripirellula amarantea]
METSRFKISLAASALLLLGTAGITPNSASAQQQPVQLTSAESAVNRSISQTVERVEMLVKSSRILTLEDRIPKFQVHNETLLDATPVSQNQIQIFAKAPGTTQLNLWDTNDKLYTVDVTVIPDAREVEGILGTQLPYATLKVLPVNNSAIISGTVTNVDDVDRAVAIVEQFYATVVNNIKVVGVQQILLHTRIMEVSRTKLRELGIDWGSFTDDAFFYSSPGGLIDIGQSTVAGDIPSGVDTTNRLFVNNGDFSALISALRQQDLVKYLAEPTVVATHGRPARFNVGGRVPYIVPGNNGQVQVQYEEFGTSIDFLPFVVGPGRVRLEVRPEVSEVDSSLSLTVSGAQVVGFRSRYVETAVELQAGQTFAIAGLLQSRTESQTKATPLLGELPYIGTMFRKVREKRNDIELLITVTPEFVAAMDPHEVPRGGPGLNSASPNDKELYLKGHIEVPNMLGDCGCTIEGGGLSNGSCGTSECYGSATSVAPSYGQEIYGGAVISPSGIPAGAIVPGNEPIVVSEGITISSPQN